MALLLGFLTAVLFGIGDFLAGQVTRRMPTLAVIFYAQLAGTIMMIPIVLLTTDTYSTDALIWGGLSGAALAAGFLFYFRALANGKMGVSASICGIMSAIMPVTAGLLFGERPGVLIFAGLVVLTLAIVLISKQDENDDTAASAKVMLEAATAGFLLGLFFVLIYVPPAGEAMWTVLFTMAGALFLTAAVMIVQKTSLQLTVRAGVLVSIMGIFQTLAAVLYIIGVNMGLLSVIGLAGSMSPLFTLLCARLIIQEKLSGWQMTGFLMALAGACLLVLGS
ncbi:EamA family transporter [Alkalicoccus luteus]|uniref:DMT family transporter n=1 Tax=Alkalicoccus luteus TaxID=1237094 RepID=A0A969TXR7_9BACI|nr:DMT family transporter [Alkalicoccus luteus]